jgi:hypothetical protein
VFRGLGLGSSHLAGSEPPQRGAVSASLPWPPPGPAPCFWGLAGGQPTQSSIPAFTVPRAGAAALRPGLRSFGETARQGCRADRGFGSLRSWLVGEKDPLSWPGRVEQICHLADV